MLSRNLLREVQKKTETPSEWIEKHFYVPDPRDPVTGETLPPGPLRLAEHQKRIIDEALSRDKYGRLKYSTVVYSAPKKSGKSAITSAVVLYVAHQNSNAFVACLANDGKQSADRLYGPIYTCFRLHRQLGGIFKDVQPNKIETTLPNYTTIEAVPCDAAGEAGAQPILTAWCFDEETEILTRDGWKRYDQYSYEDAFATVNKFGEIEYQHPTHIHRSFYAGEMYLLDSRRVSLCVTPNHKLYGKFGYDIYELRKNTWEKRLAKDVVNGKGEYGLRIETQGYVGEYDPVPIEIVIPATKRKPELRIPIELYLKFLGWYLAEGCTHKGDTIMLAQSKASAYYEEIKDTISELGFEFHEWSGTRALIFYDARLAKHLKPLGKAHKKYIPTWIKRLPPKYINILLESYWKGDGCKADTAFIKYGTKKYATNSPQLRDDLMELAVIQGNYVSVTTYQDKRWGLPVFTISVKMYKDGNRYVGVKNKKWQKILYDGVIHCPTVPNGTVIVRRHGKVHSQGNSEVWGFESDSKKRLFSELTVPPTLYGKAMRWIESYAGYVGKSELLENLYIMGFLEGEPHPDFSDLQGKLGSVVRVNEAAGMFVYWDTEPRMPWQVAEYYEKEAAILKPTEFRRIHGNEWVSPMSSFVEDTWWDACHDARLPALQDGDRTPVVVGIDMAVSRDCAALVAVTRDPFFSDTKVAVRAVRIFNPKKFGGIIDQEDMIRPVIEDWARRWNVVCWVYDPHEMAKLAQDLVRAGLGWFKPFGQTNPRAVSDKQLYDMIVHRQISWNKDTTMGDVGARGSSGETLYKHITQAGAATNNESYRLEKLSSNTKIDAAVALSQAAFVAMKLAIGNTEFGEESLIRKLQNREISLGEFSARVRDTYPQLQERIIDGR